MAQGTTGDALWRWIFGGLAAGAVVLGLLVAAYAIGYNRGQDAAGTTAAAPTKTVPTTPPETTTQTTPTETEPIAAGEELWSSAGCASCHTVDGSASVGPTVQGLAGSNVELDNGQTVTADDAYLMRSITDPDAEIVAGYSGGIMSAAVAPQKLDTRPQDVEALVAYIKAQR